MMGGCFSSSRTDGSEDSHHHVSLRSLMAARQTPLRPSHCLAMEILERKLGFSTRKTLQARTNLLDTACHNLAKAKERALISLPPSFYARTDAVLFPLPLPPGYAPSPENVGRNSVKSSVHAKSRSTASTVGKLRVDVQSASKPASFTLGADNTSSCPQGDPNITCKSGPLSKPNSISICRSNSAKSRADDVSVSDFSTAIPVMNSSTCSVSSSSPRTPRHSRCDDSTTCSNSSCEAQTPSSSISSLSFSAAPSSLSQSSSFSSSSTNSSSDNPLNSLGHALEHEGSFFTTALPFSPPTHKPKALESPLKLFSAAEIEMACGNFDVAFKLRDGSMGPFYGAYLSEERSRVAIARVATKLSRKKWEAQLQGLAGLAHPNVCKAIGYSYARGKRCRREEVGACEGGRALQGISSMGLIVYESMGSESLEEFVQDVEKGHSHIDWSTRLKIAIGIADGLSYLLHTMPSYVSYGDLSMSNITVDFSMTVKLFDFVVSTDGIGISIDNKGRKAQQWVQSLGNVLLKLFDFTSYSEVGGSQGTVQKTYPPADAKLVIQLIASCLLEDDALRPSIQHVARVLRGINKPTHQSLKRSKSFTYKKNKPLD